MNIVLRSAKPYWIYLILTGQKTIEVGKSFPKSQNWNKVVEMYCSKDMRSFKRIPEKDREWMRQYLGKVACRFVCDNVTKITTWQRTWYNILFQPTATTTEYGIWNDDFKQMCMTWKEINDYGQKKPLYGWHISDLKIYDKPKELSEFYKPCPTKEKGDCLSCDCLADNDYGGICTNNLTRPPQSYMYVEEV